MLRQAFHAGDVLGIAQDLHFFRRRDVQHVDTLADLAGEAQQARRRRNGGLDVAHHGMAGPVALDRQAAALLESVFVLRMESRPALDGA